MEKKSRLQNLGLYLYLVLAVFAIYANSFNNQFLFDDEFLIQKNSFLRSWSSIFDIFRSSSTTGAGGVDSFYRPIQTLCYLLVFQIFSFTPFGFHLLNTALHSVNATLVFHLGQKLELGRSASFAAAILWAVHPIHTEAVTYMSATADTLYTLFCLSGMIVLIPFTSLRILAACGFFILGLLSKEAALVFPALAVSVRFLTCSARWSWRSYLITWPMWILAIFYLVARKTILNFDNTFQFYKEANVYSESFVVRLYTFFATLPSYLKLLVWPSGLHMERNFPVFTEFFFWPVLLGFAIFAASLILVGLARSLPIAFGILWFWAAHAPHTGVLLPVNAFFLEHWMYLPSIGLFLGGLSAVFSFGLPRPVVYGAVALVALSLGWRVYEQNKIWATPVSFFENVLQYNGNAVRAHNNLAMAYSDQSRFDEAAEHYLKAIEIADTYPQTRYNLALLLVMKGRENEAVAQLERAIVINPNFYQSYGKLYEIYFKRGDTEKAALYRRKYEETIKALGF